MNLWTANPSRRRPARKRVTALLVAMMLAFGFATIPAVAWAAVPGAPTAQEDSMEVTGGETALLSLYAVDDEMDPVTFQVVSTTTHGTLGALSEVDCSEGYCFTNVEYTPDAGATDDSFTFRATDSGGHASDLATYTLTVLDPDAPTAYDNSAEVGKDATTTVNLSGDDPNGAELNFAIVSAPDHGTLSTPTAADCAGSSACESTVAYTTAGYQGDDSFTFKVSNGTKTSTLATISLSVEEAPCEGKVVNNGTIKLGVNCKGELNVGDDGLKFMPTGNDSTSPGCACEGWGVADALSGVTGFANQSVGTSSNLEVVSFDTTATTAVSVVDVGTTFRVTQDYHPSTASSNAYEDTVTVKNVGATDTKLRYRRVMDWDVEPTEFDEFVTISKGNSPNVVFTSDDGFASADPLEGPSDLGSTGSFTDAGPDDHGALFDFDFGTLAAGASHTFKIYYGAAATETGALNALNAVGAEAYSLGEPNTTNGPTLGTPNTFLFGFTNIGGSAVLAPNAVDDTATAISGTAKSIDVLGNDTDPNGDALTVTGHGSAGHGTASCTTSGCSYTSNSGYTGPDSFSYTISDGNGGTDSATVSLTVNAAANHVPVATDDSKTTAEDTAGVVDVRANDTDADGDTLSITAHSTPGHGSVTCTTSCTYTPAANYSGSDSFTYTINDGHTGTATGTVSMTITAVNDKPVAVDDSTTMVGNTSKAIAVLVNDTDVESDSLTVTSKTNPAHGTVSCTTAGSCTYTPTTGYSGADSFDYTVSDGHGGTDVGTVRVTVTAPVTKPGAPKIGTATAGAAGGTRTATARWTAPTSTGGAPITGYTLTALRYSSAGKVVATKTVSLAASRRSNSTALAAGNWRFRVAAVNRIGTGPVSALSNLVAAR